MAFAATTRVGSFGTITCALTAVALTLVMPSLWTSVGTGVLLVGLLIGVPHGAVDHLLPLYRQRTTRWTLPVFVLVYAAVAALSWAAITTFRTAGLLAFLALSAVHFGTGEATFARIRDGRRPGTQWAWVATGVAVVALPITTHQDAVLPYLQAFAPHADWALKPATTTTITAVVLIVMTAAVLRQIGDKAYLQAAEMTLLVALMALSPPAVAFGVYFGGWHAVRHLMILLAENPANRTHLAHHAFAHPLRQFAVAATMPTIAALIVVALAWFWSAHGQVDQFVAQDLAILAALTVPHTAVVWWLDRTRPAILPAQPKIG